MGLCVLIIPQTVGFCTVFTNQIFVNRTFYYIRRHNYAKAQPITSRFHE